MVVTPAQAGVQFKGVWIPACAGMTDRYCDSELKKYFRRYFWYTTQEVVSKPQIRFKGPAEAGLHIYSK
jgi:hypothetical protein